MADHAFGTQPPESTTFRLSLPAAGVLLVTLDRARQMNSIPTQGHIDGDALFSWFDDEPSLTIAVVTGSGSKAFCAGADLLEQRDRGQGPRKTHYMPPSGFAGISRRAGKKPIIAAVNGFALGGGFEICLNCDIVVASPNASFGLPEVERGLYAGAGGLSRLVRVCGMQLASELALTGRRITAQEAKALSLVNKIATSPETLLEESLTIARKIASLSPDAIIVTRSGLRQSWETASVERASQQTEQRYQKALMVSENMRIGLEAFAAKKQPIWVKSSL